MARDSSFDERRRQREREDEEERLEAERKLGLKKGDKHAPLPSGGQLADLIHRAEPLIEQVNHLYNQYLAGVEQRPPVERRKQLEQLMGTLQGMSKPTPAAQFRFNALFASYISHRDRWDKLTKDLEAGKITRPTAKRG